LSSFQNWVAKEALDTANTTTVIGSCSDSDIFITSVVLLQLYSTKMSGDKIILWQNPRLSSVRYCRPIRMQFKKETAELAKEETSLVEEGIKSLKQQ
jgi:hypothetical protein